MKSCRTNSVPLSALADGELTGWAAWRLRRHIAGCAACAGELEGWKRLNQSLLVADITNETGLRLATRTVSFRQRTSLLGKCLLAGGMVTAAAVAGIFFVTPTRHGNQALAARAEVDAAMSGVRTATWSATLDNYNMRYTQSTGLLARHNTIEFYAQLSPPQIIWREKEASRSKNGPSGSRAILTSAEENKAYIEESNSRRLFLFRKRRGDIVPPSPDAQTLRQRTRKTILAAMFTSLDVERERMMGSPGSRKNTPRPLTIPPTMRRVIRNGQTVLEISDGTEHPGVAGYGEYYTFWADEETHRLVETEMDVIDLKTRLPIQRFHSFHYRYNQPLPPKAFDISVPSGTPVHVDGKESGVTR